MVYATVVVFLIAAIIMTISLISVIMRRCRSDKRFYFLSCMVAVVIISIGYLLEITSVNESAALTSVKITYLGSCYLAPLFLLFVVDYCRVKIPARLLTVFRWVVFSVATLNCLVAWTADRHDLLYMSRFFDSTAPIKGLQVFPGPLYPVSYIIALVCVFAASVILVRRYMSHGVKTRRIYGMILVLGIAPLAANLFHMTYTYGFPVGSYDLNITPFVLAFVNLLFYMSVVRYGIFDFVPIAYSSVLASMKDAFVIVDADMECLEANKVARELFPGITECRNGTPVSDASNWPAELADLRSHGSETGIIFNITNSDGERVVEASVDVVREHDALLGYVIIVRDVTENRRLLHELERAAYTDSLTGIYNRRHFMELAAKEFERSRRTGLPCYAMIFDLDNFKRVNDTYRHFAGDKVLRDVVARVREVVRSYDLFARYGGEEFAIMLAVLGDTSMDIAFNLAQRICENVARKPFVYENIEIPVTVSIGVACGTDAETLEELLLAADDAMYKAKLEGKNRVAVNTK